MHDLRKISAECINEMKKAGIPVRDDKILDIRTGDIAGFGLCSDDGYYENFTITISSDLIQEICPLTELKQIIIHELIHTCPRCWSHGRTWSKYALIMNDIYGYSLLEGRDNDSIFHKDKPILHRYQCPKCGSRYDSRTDGGHHKCPFCHSCYKEIQQNKMAASL